MKNGRVFKKKLKNLWNFIHTFVSLFFVIMFGKSEYEVLIFVLN